MPRTLLLVAAGLAVTAAAWRALPMTAAGEAQAAAPGPCWMGDASLDYEESAFLGMINRYRGAQGLAELIVSPRLTRSARWMARDVAKRRDFDHADSLGRNPSERAADCGYSAGAGENIAAGTGWSAASDAFAAWKHSPGHDRNMLGDYHVIGIARDRTAGSTYEWYWVTDFGRDEDLEPGDTPGFRSATHAPKTLALRAGSNLVTWPGAAQPPAAVPGLAGPTGVSSIYSFDSATGGWTQYGPGLPDYVNTLHMLQPGTAYWLVCRGEMEIAVSE